jgi:hypothetical protein|mmetsp:Transcript_12229/g.18751  ORF Transcript_12229/g.18751 Transcript_12229/m.18751 type:complete len:109 (+) Transcript_12229:484-810(+)
MLKGNTNIAQFEKTETACMCLWPVRGQAVVQLPLVRNSESNDESDVFVWTPLASKKISFLPSTNVAQSPTKIATQSAINCGHDSKQAPQLLSVVCAERTMVKPTDAME